MRVPAEVPEAGFEADLREHLGHTPGYVVDGARVRLQASSNWVPIRSAGLSADAGSWGT